MSDEAPIQVVPHDDGAILQVLLNRPKANILDAAMTAALTAFAENEARAPGVRAIVFEGAGPHFSFGASVEEHLPDKVAGMLSTFHGLFKALIAARRPLLAVVRGQCLGGGLELAAFCQRVFCAPNAFLGQPELQLGVFAPAASVILPRRVGQAAADDLLLTARSVKAVEALAMGLVDDVAEDPLELALGYAREHFLEKSASALALAVEAARGELHRAFLEHIDRLETMYLDELMKLDDPLEGLNAFLGKRKPEWKHS